ncbi:cyclin-dependent kinase inhibitor 1C-like [Drosophila miranda]|uniref:cyclin-dependent kinase inhibitor 1C-like n=1 Tax=Drosophila miranda TaxID=7229 RepID=UPI0007E64A86|nr:cyclin-dependent kinase inhibitor 1C-like [Drosophila miranda]
MFKYVAVVFALVACVAGKPGVLLPAPLSAVPAPLFAAPAPVVTATSSQVVARNFNGIAAASVIAPLPVAAPVPIATRLISPIGAPLISKYAATAPLPYTTPLGYAAAPQPIFF